MMNSLFASYGDTVSPTTIRCPRKGAIIEAGQVGIACAWGYLTPAEFESQWRQKQSGLPNMN